MKHSSFEDIKKRLIEARKLNNQRVTREYGIKPKNEEKKNG